MKNMISRKEICSQLTEYSKSQAPNLWEKIDPVLPGQSEQICYKKKPLRFAVPAAGIIAAAVLIAVAVPQLAKAPRAVIKPPAQSQTSGLISSNRTAPSQSSVQGGESASSKAAHSTTFGELNKKIAGSGHSAGVCIPCFVKYGGGIYRVGSQADNINAFDRQYIGRQLTKYNDTNSSGEEIISNWGLFEIQGVDTAKEIAIDRGGYLPALYYCSAVVSFDGRTYEIADDISTKLDAEFSADGKAVVSVKNGKYLGMAGTKRVYAINGTDPLNTIAVQIDNTVFADASLKE